ncbi:MAG: YbhB/YbcL family Raf kinase inhibitor-like protein [Chitinispirillaceae bacterium]|nr:YbhB/YbcL family Raf kinase inhibitor-like protein [Chitinispirillaceae bacterium]
MTTGLINAQKKEAIVLFAIAAALCCTPAQGAVKKKGAAMPSILLESPAFGHKQSIPQRYTCDGEDVSPPLAWKNVPPEAKSIVLISDDPDAPAGDWVHWVVYDLSPEVDTLPEHIMATDTILAGKGKQGRNDFRRIGYGGPCPPSGTHRYFFKIYALDTMLNLPAGKTKKEIEQAMKGHVLAQGELIGTYQRTR